MYMIKNKITSTKFLLVLKFTKWKIISNIIK